MWVLNSCHQLCVCVFVCVGGQRAGKEKVGAARGVCVCVLICMSGYEVNVLR